MISVAMTSYNGEQYIIKQLQSLIDQTIPPDEVIIVDDCSLDGTVEVIKNFISVNSLGRHWKLICHDQNKGFIETFFQAITNTNGEYIFLCDQDDLWASNKIALMVKEMIKNPNILALSSRFQKIDEFDNNIKNNSMILYSNNNLIRKPIKENECVKIDVKEVLKYNISPGCTTAFKSTIIEKYKKLNQNATKLPHDWKINIIAALGNGLYFLNTTTTYYRLHHNNTLGINRSFNITERIKVVTSLINERTAIYNLVLIYSSLNLDQKNEDIIGLLSYLQKIIIITNNRVEALQKLDLRKILRLLTKIETYKYKFLDSIIVDSLIIIKSKCKS